MDRDDEEALQRMDTNGFGKHVELELEAEKRFTKASLHYMSHVVSGDHDSTCGDNECEYWQRLFDAYMHLLSV